MWLLKLLSILIKYRKTIILNTLIVTVIAAGVSFVLPKKYLARTTVLPPETETGIAGLMGLSSGILAQAATNFALPIMATPSDLYASMLESESILVKAVDSLKLTEVYEVESRWEAVVQLKERIKIKVEMDGIVTLDVEAKDPVTAANIANLLVFYLDEFKKQMRSQKGREFSSFLERRLTETDSSLQIAANQLRNFQETHGAIALDVQSEALIRNLAEEKARLNSAEVELEVMRKQLYPDHPDVIRRELLVSEIRGGLRRAEIGATNPRDSIISALEVPLSRVPDLSLKLAVLTRNLKIFEITYELLSQQYEMARLQERRDTPTITVLDMARPPSKPYWPRKKWIVLTAFALSFLATATMVVVREMFVRETSPAASIVAPLREMLDQVRRKPLG